MRISILDAKEGAEKAWRMEVELHRCKNDARKLYQKVEPLSN